MKPGEREAALVEELLRAKLRERFPELSRERARFDRTIGKGGSGWTSKFLRQDPKAGSPSLQTVLAAVVGLGLSPSEFLREALGEMDQEVSRFLAYTEETRDRLRPLVEEVVEEVLEKRRAGEDLGDVV